MGMSLYFSQSILMSIGLMWRKKDRKVVRWAKLVKTGTLVVEMIGILKVLEQPVVMPAEITAEIIIAGSEKIVGIVTNSVSVIGKMSNKRKIQIVITEMEMSTPVVEEVDQEVAAVEEEDKVYLVVECNLNIRR